MSMRPGPITSNGYLNFLREFRKKCCGLSAVETVRQGARQWGKLSCKQKEKYRLMGCTAMRRPRCAKKRRRSCRTRRSRRKRCMKPGLVTANDSLELLRAYRRKHCVLTPQETVKKTCEDGAHCHRNARDVSCARRTNVKE